MSQEYSVIIVTHNSENVLEKCMKKLFLQTKKALKIFIIDSASADNKYLDRYLNIEGIEVIKCAENIGFCQANNLGFDRVQTPYTLLLNPDLFLEEEVAEKSIQCLESSPKTAAVTPYLLGYDLKKDKPSNLYDSKGIDQTFYGKWFDIDQGKKVLNQEKISDTHLQIEKKEEVKAICGACFFAKTEDLKNARIKINNQYFLFNPSFYMYKEDIDLSCRLKRQKKKLYALKGLHSYHCRGWNRQKVSYQFKVMSAKNELFIHLRECHILGILFSSCKWIAARWFRL